VTDYTDFVLGRGESAGTGAGNGTKSDRKADRRSAAEARERYKALQADLKKAEKQIAELSAERSRIDLALFDPAAAGPQEKGRTMTDLMQRRASIESRLGTAEAVWMEASEALEGSATG
jgi:ATP-binding cassette subfamily F protein 3